jgi:hypothetical protein
VLLLPAAHLAVAAGQHDHGPRAGVRDRTVEGGGGPVVVDDAAGPAAERVELARAVEQRERLVVPVGEVGGAHVAPFDPGVLWPVGVVLKEDVVAAVEADAAVGVVDPAPAGASVQPGKARIGVLEAIACERGGGP